MTISKLVSSVPHVYFGKSWVEDYGVREKIKWIRKEKNQKNENDVR